MRLEELRREIDRIDGEIIELLCRRAELAREIFKVKRKEGAEVEDAEREAEVLEAWKARAGGRLEEGFVEALATKIMAYCRAVQKGGR